MGNSNRQSFAMRRYADLVPLSYRCRMGNDNHKRPFGPQSLVFLIAISQVPARKDALFLTERGTEINEKRATIAVSIATGYFNY